MWSEEKKIAWTRVQAELRMMGQQVNRLGEIESGIMPVSVKPGLNGDHTQGLVRAETSKIRQDMFATSIKITARMQEFHALEK